MKCTTLFGALVEKYAPQEDGESNHGEDEADVEVFEGDGFDIEIVGMKKLKEQLRKISELEIASLCDSPVDRLGEAPSTPSHFPSSLTDLDLSHSRLSDWREVCITVCGLPALSHLTLGHITWDLSSIPTIGDEGAGGEAEERGRGRLQRLALPRCNLTWSEAIRLGHLFGSLGGLVLLGNPLGPVPEHPRFLQAFPNLRSLNLEGCGVDNWKGVWRLSRLPMLERLVLNKNAITSLSYFGSGEDSVGEGEWAPFSKLQSLSLAHNELSSWECIDALHHFPSLTEVRLEGNPLTARAGIEVARQTSIARVGRLRLLNGSDVNGKERTEAERIYIRQCMLEARKAAGAAVDDDALRIDAKLHPRFEEVVKVHGRATLGRHAEGGGGSLADSMISLELQCMVMDAESFNPVTKRVPRTMQVGRLRVIAKKAFGITEGTDFSLVYSADKRGLPTQLTDDEENLAYFGVEGDGKLMVQQMF